MLNIWLGSCFKIISRRRLLKVLCSYWSTCICKFRWREEAGWRRVQQCCWFTVWWRQNSPPGGACVASPQERHWYPSLWSPATSQRNHRDPLPWRPHKGKGGFWEITILSPWEPHICDRDFGKSLYYWEITILGNYFSVWKSPLRFCSMKTVIKLSRLLESHFCASKLLLNWGIGSKLINVFSHILQNFTVVYRLIIYAGWGSCFPQLGISILVFFVKMVKATNNFSSKCIE